MNKQKPKYKVGDVVKIVTEGFATGLHQFQIGEVVVIKGVYVAKYPYPNYYKAASETDYWFVDDSEIELID